MCGRYVSTRSPENLVQHFRATEWRPEEALEPSWNVAPTNPGVGRTGTSPAGEP
jgi:putative SOS response-associated peptidase YedK